MKVDLAMWTKNSAKYLDTVLTRIEQVIPEQAINHKFIIDDKSEDRTVEIAKKHGWDAYPNPYWGVTAAANEALSKVETDYWISFEHDLLLSKKWWHQIPKHLKKRRVIIAQGIRLSTNPLIHEMDTYIVHRLKQKRQVIGRYISLDNTIYKTEVLRQLGGFPTVCPICADVNLRDLVLKKGYIWFADASVMSQHIRGTVIDDIRHRGKLRGLCTCEVNRAQKMIVNLKYLAFSPFRAVILASKRRNLQLVPLYILYRIEMFRWS